jgi:hypothetical protein
MTGRVVSLGFETWLGNRSLHVWSLSILEKLVILLAVFAN